MPVGTLQVDPVLLGVGTVVEWGRHVHPDVAAARHAQLHGRRILRVVDGAAADVHLVDRVAELMALSVSD